MTSIFQEPPLAPLYNFPLNKFAVTGAMTILSFRENLQTPGREKGDTDKHRGNQLWCYYAVTRGSIEGILIQCQFDDDLIKSSRV